MANDKSKDWKKFKEENELENTQEHPIDSELFEEEKENSALEHPSYLALEEKLTMAEQKAHENWEKSVRALAEVDNMKRRAERDIENAHRFGLEKIISSLIPVIDSLDQALQLAEKEENAGMVEGLLLTLKLFINALEKHGVEQIDPQGAMFNPHEHEAMSIQEVPGAVDNSILAVFQKGYKLNDRVIRPARVIVAKTKS